MKQIDHKKEMKDVELSIGRALRVGILIATIVMIFGIVLLVIYGGDTGYPTNKIPISPIEIGTGLVALKPFAFMTLGLFLLIMTPVLRVIVSIYAFYVEKDYLYVWITTMVLVILIISMIVGYLTGK